MNEVDLQGNVVRLHNIMEPESPKAVDATPDDAHPISDEVIEKTAALGLPNSPTTEEQEIDSSNVVPKHATIDYSGPQWTDEMTVVLSQFFSQTALRQIEEIYLGGLKSPADTVSSHLFDDSGINDNDGETVESPVAGPSESLEKDKRDKNQRGRNNRKGRIKDKKKHTGLKDDRQVFSEVCSLVVFNAFTLILHRLFLQKKTVNPYMKQSVHFSMANWSQKQLTVNASA